MKINYESGIMILELFGQKKKRFSTICSSEMKRVFYATNNQYAYLRLSSIAFVCYFVFPLFLPPKTAWHFYMKLIHTGTKRQWHQEEINVKWFIKVVYAKFSYDLVVLGLKTSLITHKISATRQKEVEIR